MQKGQPLLTRFIVNRLISLIPVLIGITLVVFFAIRLVPGDVALSILREEATPELVAEIRRIMGLDQPIHVQLVDWFAHLARLDLGKSFTSGRPILPDILVRLPATLELALAATTISIMLGIPLGLLTSVKSGSSLSDIIERVVSVVGLSMPRFWLALVLILVVALKFRLLPAVGYVPFTEDPVNNLRRLILPAFSLGLRMTAIVARYTRSSLLDVLGQDYMRTARGKGLSEWRVITRHGLKNALIPVVTVIGIQMSMLIGGTVIVEEIFTWPGIGRFALYAIYERDYPVIQATVMFIAFFFVINNLLVDIIYVYLDPRIRLD
jgi:peptide/nickel transport system permease protein